MKKSILLMVASALAFAQFDIRTHITEVFNRGSNEKAGSIEFILYGEFEPEVKYARIMFGKGAVLSQTLVNPLQGDKPIQLAVALKGYRSGHKISLPQDAVTMVRAIQGENQIWLKFDFNPEEAIEFEGTLISPAPTLGLSFSLGHSKEDSDSKNRYLFENAQANLAHNTQNNFAADTYISLDLSKSILQVFPDDGSRLEFDPLYFSESTHGVETAPSPDQIVLGDQTGVGFAIEYLIARGFGPGPETGASIVPHVPPINGRFKTYFEIKNHNVANPIAVIAQDENRQELAKTTINTQTKTRFFVHQLFPDMEVSQLVVDHDKGDDFLFGYESDGNIACSPIRPNYQARYKTTLFPYQHPSVFDGLVFTQDEPLVATFVFWDLEGVRTTHKLDFQNNKEIVSMSELPGAKDAIRMEIETSKPSAVLHLRRLVLEDGKEYLFAVPII